MEDFVIEGGFDDRGILEGFKRLVDEGTKTGRKIGAGFGDELNRFGKRSIASLQQELSRLQSRQLRVNVDSTAFAKTSEKIKEVQKLIDQANNKKLTLQFDPGSINGLTARLQQLQSRALDLNVDTKEFQDAQLEVNELQQKIQRLSRVPVAAGSLEALNRQLQDLQSRQVRLNVDTKEFQDAQLQVDALQQKIQRISRVPVAAGSLEALNRQLQDLQARQVRLNVDSRAFAATQAQIRQVERQIEEINQKKIDLEINPASINGLQRDLQRLQARTLELNVDTKEFQDAQLQVDALQQKIQRLSRVSVAAGSLEALNRQLQDLQARQVRLKVDSRAFSVVGAQIQQVQGQIDNVNNRRLLINADPRSVVAVRQRLLDINQQLERVKIGSRSFEILSAQAKAAQRQLDLASRQTQNIANDLIGLALPAGGSLGAVLALGQALRFVGDQTRQFDSAAAAVRTLGVNSEDLAKRLKVVSRETRGARSEVELLRAAYDVASAGFADAASAAQILEASARGATGGFSDINTVANATTSVLNAYGLSADQASTLVDKFIQTQNDGKITVGQLADQIGKLAPIAASAGVSIDEFGAAIAAATVAGVQPEAAVTGLRQAISSIIKPSKDAEEVASRLGVGFNAAALQSKGLSGVLSDIASKTKGNAALNLQLFGSVEALTAVQPLLNDELVKFNKLLLNQRNSAGVAKKAADEVANTVEGATKRIQGSLSNLGVELGKLSSPVIIESLDLLGAGLNTVAGNLEKIFALPGGGEFLTGLLSNANKEAKILTKGQEGLIQGSLRLAQILGNSAGLASNAGQLITSAAQAKIFGKDLDKAGVAAKKVADQVGKLPAATGKAAKSGQSLTDQTEAAARAEEDRAKQVERAAAAEKARAKTIAEINELRRQEPVRRLDDQITVGRGLLNFAQASLSLEQEGFNTLRARSQYEIDNAKAYGLTRDQIAARERDNDQLKKQSLIEQYKSLLSAQAVESVMLQLSQRRAQVEAQAAGIKAQQAAVEAQIAIAKAKTPEDAAKAAEAARLAQINVGLAQQQLRILQATAPLEAAAAQAAAETARQQLRTQGASLGIEQILLKIAPAQTINNDAFAKGVGLLNKLNGEAGKLLTPIESTGETIVKTFKDANGVINIVSRTADKAGTSVKELGENVGLAEGFTDDIKKANLADSIGAASLRASAFAEQMYLAANSARSLKDDLTRAAGLSPSRFTGGSVDAGTRYRINDGPGGRSLGQESFLSRAGDLSLINRPFSSLWTAPSAGIVLPAVLTDQLKQRGAFDTGRRGGKRIAAAVAAGARPSGQSTTDRLEVAVTNLAAQVQALNRKSWTVQQRVTNSPGTTQVRLLSSML